MLEAPYASDPGFLGSMLLLYASRYFQQAATTDALALYDRVESLSTTAGEVELHLQALCERVFVEVQANRFEQARERLTREPTYNFQLRAFLAAARGARTNITDGREGVKNMQVIDAIYQSAGMRVRGT